MVGLFGGSGIGTGLRPADQIGGQVDVPVRKGSKKLSQEERAHEYQLKTITGMTRETDYPNALGYFSHMRSTRIELPPIGIKQALEILNNGDCSTDK